MENIKKIVSKSFDFDFFSEDSLVKLFSVSHSKKRYYFTFDKKLNLPLFKNSENILDDIICDSQRLFNIFLKDFYKLYSIKRLICIDEINDNITYKLQFKIKTGAKLLFKYPIYKKESPLKSSFEITFFDNGNYNISDLDGNDFYDSLTEFYLYSNFGDKIKADFIDIKDYRNNKNDVIDLVFMYFF